MGVGLAQLAQLLRSGTTGKSDFHGIAHQGWGLGVALLSCI